MDLKTIDLSFLKRENIRNFFFQVCQILIEKDNKLIFRDNGTAYGLSYPSTRFLTYITTNYSFKFHNKNYKLLSKDVCLNDILEEVRLFDISSYKPIEIIGTTNIEYNNGDGDWLSNKLQTSLDNLKKYLETNNNIPINDLTISDKRIRYILLSKNIIDFLTISKLTTFDILSIEGLGKTSIKELINIIDDLTLSEVDKEKLNTIKNKLIMFLENPSENCDEAFCMVKANQLYDQVLSQVNELFGEDSRISRITYLRIVEEKNLTEIGELLDLSRERIRQLFLKIYRRLNSKKVIFEFILSFESNIYHVLKYIKEYKKGLYNFINSYLSICSIDIESHFIVLKNEKVEVEYTD